MLLLYLLISYSIEYTYKKYILGFYHVLFWLYIVTKNSAYFIVQNVKN